VDWNKPKKFILLFMAGFIALSIPSAAFAESIVIGSVRQVKGDALLVRKGQSIPARPRQQIMLNDILRTGPDGALGVILRDDTVLSLGPNSEFSLDEFAFAPVEDDLSFVGKMTRGTATFLTGKIGQMRPEAVKVKTPNGTIGVRGTQFLVQVAAQ
jgi:hypothetical protein